MWALSDSRFRLGLRNTRASQACAGFSTTAVPRRKAECPEVVTKYELRGRCQIVHQRSLHIPRVPVHQATVPYDVSSPDENPLIHLHRPRELVCYPPSPQHRDKSDQECGQSTITSAH